MAPCPLPFCPPLSKRSGERRELPQLSRQSPGRKSIFGIFEAHKTADKKLIFCQRPFNRLIRGMAPGQSQPVVAVTG